MTDDLLDLPNLGGVSFKAVALTEDASTGGFEAILSTADLDRDGEIIDPGAFEPLPASIPIYYDHDWMDKALPIGRGVPRYEGDVLKLAVTFAGFDRAQQIRQLVVEKVVDSMSVGYVNARGKVVDGVPHITSADAFEGSVTAIPANTQALIGAAKTGARNSTSDAGRLQQIHDLSIGNGAVCVKEAPMTDEAKTVLADLATKALTEGVVLTGTYKIDGDSITFGDPSPLVNEAPAETSPTPDAAAEAAVTEEPAAEAAEPEPEEDPAIAEQLARITQRAST